MGDEHHSDHDAQRPVRSEGGAAILCTAKRSARALRRNVHQSRHDRVVKDVTSGAGRTIRVRAGLRPEREARQDHAWIADDPHPPASGSRSRRPLEAVDHEADDGGRLVRGPAGSRRRAPRCSPAIGAGPRERRAPVPALEAHAIVAHQAGEAAVAAAPRASACAPAATCRRPTARGSGRPPRRPRRSSRESSLDRQPSLAVSAARVAAGRPRTTKRAPSRAPAPRPRRAGPSRFSAQIRPRCASTICREIDRPSPEFWPKPLLGPVGVEALEDALDGVRRDARARHPRRRSRCWTGVAPQRRRAPSPSGRRERARVVDQVVDDLAEPAVVPEHEEGVPAAADAARPSSSIERVVLAPRVRWRPRPRSPAACAMSTGSASARASSASRREASEMSLISRSSRRTSCWMTPSRRAARFVGPGERQRLHRAAQRGQRVLQLVRHVGREALDRLDAVVERAGHVAQRARQMADLVGAVGEVRDLLARLDARAARARRLREAAHRPGDGAGEQQRQHDHHARRRPGRPAGCANRSEAMMPSMSPPWVESSSAPRTAR